MGDLTFNELPKAVSELFNKLESIERLLIQQKSTENFEPDEILSIEQAGKLLGLSKATIYGYVHRAEIPVSKRGKRLYFSKLELLDWVKEGRRKTMSEIAQNAASRLQRNGL